MSKNRTTIAVRKYQLDALDRAAELYFDRPEYVPRHAVLDELLGEADVDI